MAEDTWVQFDAEKELFPGDIIRLHFKTMGSAYITAIQIASLESKLEKDPRFLMLRHSIPDIERPTQIGEFYVDVKVLTGVYRTHFAQQLVVTGALTATVIAKVVIGALTVALIGWIFSVGFDGAEKLVKASGEAAEKAEGAIKAISIMAAVIGILVAIKWIK